MTLAHGGNLHKASLKFGVPVEQWIDLSTGINPYSWPVPEIPIAVWRRLPDTDDQLLSVAAKYYGCHSDAILPIPGSQFGIEVIPKVVPKGVVAVPVWGYAEHALHWSRQGHTLVWYNNVEHLLAIASSKPLSAAVLINPNNPSTELISELDVSRLKSLMASYQGLLVVDEAFMDAIPEYSSCHDFISAEGDRSRNSKHVIILRSVGKFFGLAGLRLGFVIADQYWLSKMERFLSPWAVNGPARWIGRRALEDVVWQQYQRQALSDYSSDWQARLSEIFPQLSWFNNPLFVTGIGTAYFCKEIHQRLAAQGIYTRLIERTKDTLSGVSSQEGGIRIGLPHSKNNDCVIEKMRAVSVSCQSR